MRTRRITRDCCSRICARARHGSTRVYLDLHGAMVAEHIDDADGELLRARARVVGPHVPVVASLDYHANVSPRDGRRRRPRWSRIAPIRTSTWRRAARARRAACTICCGDRARRESLQQIAFLIAADVAVHARRADALADAAARSTLERSPLLSLSLTPGFPAADVAECGPAIFACGARRATRSNARRASSRQPCRRASPSSRSSCTDRHRRARRDSHAMRRAARPARRSSPTRRTTPAPAATPTRWHCLKALIDARRRARARRRDLRSGRPPRARTRPGRARPSSLQLGAASGSPGETPLHAPASRSRRSATAASPARALLSRRALRTGADGAAARSATCASPWRAASSRPRTRRCSATSASSRPSCAVLALKSSVHFRADFGDHRGRASWSSRPRARTSPIPRGCRSATAARHASRARATPDTAVRRRAGADGRRYAADANAAALYSPARP